MKWTLRFLFGLLTVIGVPVVVYAQATTAIRIVISGGVSPVSNDLPISGWVCGQPKIVQPLGTVHNPKLISIDDPSDNTKSCVYTDTGVAPSPLIGLPFGATVYSATVAFVNSVGPGQVSLVSNPFDHPGVAPTTAPTGLKVSP